MAAAGVGDWRPPHELYRQCVQLADRDKAADPLDTLRGKLAGALDYGSLSYADRFEFVVHAGAHFADVNGYKRLDAVTVERLYRDQRFGQPGNRSQARPGPYETAVETARRQRDAVALTRALAGTGTSGILYGSCRYAPYLEVHGNTPRRGASDLDIVVIVPDRIALLRLSAALTTIAGVDFAGVAEFDKRVRIFLDRYNDGRTILSHKFRMWVDGMMDRMFMGASINPKYLLSLHIVPLPPLDYMLVEGDISLTASPTGAPRFIRDYRNHPNNQPDRLYRFDGNHCDLPTYSKPAELGTLRTGHIFYIDEADRYHPAMYHTFALPEVALLWDEAKVGPRFQRFVAKLLDRLHFERQRHPHQNLMLSYAHARRHRLAPWVIELLDAF